MIAAGLLAACNSGATATPTPTAEAKLSSTQAPKATPTATAEARLRSTQAPKATPTPTAEAKLSSTQAPQAPIVSPTPTPTAAARPGSTQAPADAYAAAASAIPFFDEWLSEYETWCHENENHLYPIFEDSTDVTYGELSAALAMAISAMPTTNPPDVVARWQNVAEAVLQFFKDVVDEQPKDDEVDLISLQDNVRRGDQPFAEDTYDEVDEEIPGYVRYQMASAGCILEGHLRDAATLKAVEFPNATPVAPGEVVADSLDGSDGYFDLFRFQAEQGQLYLMTLIHTGGMSRWGTELYDADGQRVPQFVDVWTPFQPPGSGEYYFEIGGSGGDYKLKLIALSGIDDDHGNRPDEATSITAGQAVAGTVDEWADVDYFRFQAEEGQAYRIDVVAGTLPDALLDVEKYDDWNFSFERTEGGRSIVGEAPGTGPYWVSVKGSEGDLTGAYILTVAVP